MAYNYGWNYKTFTNSDDSKYAGSVFTYANLSQARLGTVNVNVNTLGNMNGYAEITAVSNDTDCISAPMSGRPLSWDDILSFSSDANNPTPLFSIDYPYWENGKQKRHTLVVKATIDASISTGRKIGSISPSVYGDHINVHLYFYERKYMIPLGSEEEIPYDVRIGSGIHYCTVFKPNTLDVEESVSYLEFFYASEVPGDWDDNLHQVFVGISNKAVVGEDENRRGVCSCRLWAPNMFGETVNAYQYYFGLHNPNSVPYDMSYGYEAGEDGYGNGNPTHDLSSDDIVQSNIPTLGVVSAGFVNVYKVTSGLLSDLGEALFPEPILEPGFNVIQAINQLSNTFWNGKLLDYIVDCHIIPVNVLTSTTANIRCGGKELRRPDTQSPYSASLVTDSYVTVDCGYITIGECFANFLDYTVKCKLYLPCYGYVDIPAEFWNGGTLSVKYTFNVIDGTFVAFVYGKAKHSALNSLVGQYSGSAVTHIPIRGQDYSQLISGLVTTAMGVASGGVGVVGATSSIASILASKPSLTNSGSSNGSSAMMMHKIPYLIIEYPTPQFSSSYPKEKGLPLNVSAPLGKYGGMTIADEPVLDGIPCTENEKIRIRNALKTGLIFR